MYAFDGTLALKDERVRSAMSKVEALKAIRNQDIAGMNKAQDSIRVLEEQAQEIRRAIQLCQRCLDEQADMRVFEESMVTALVRPLFGGESGFKYEPVYDVDGVTLKGLQPLIAEADGVYLPPKQQGYGIRNIVSLGRRFCFNVFIGKRLGLVPFMILDEHLLNVDKQKWPLMIKFLQDVQKSIPFQFIFITHITDVEFPHTIELVKSGKVTKAIQYQQESA